MWTTFTLRVRTVSKPWKVGIDWRGFLPLIRGVRRCSVCTEQSEGEEGVKEQGLYSEKEL